MNRLPLLALGERLGPEGTLVPASRLTLRLVGERLAGVP